MKSEVTSSPTFGEVISEVAETLIAFKTELLVGYGKKDQAIPIVSHSVSHRIIRVHDWSKWLE